MESPSAWLVTSVVISWAVREKHLGSWELGLEHEGGPSTSRLKIHEAFLGVKNDCVHTETALSDPWDSQPGRSGHTCISKCPAGESWSPRVDINWPWLLYATPGTCAENRLSGKIPFTKWKKCFQRSQDLENLACLHKNMYILCLPKWVRLTGKWISTVNWSW